jgi:hypothetical protein
MEGNHVINLSQLFFLFIKSSDKTAFMHFYFSVSN